MNLSINKRPDSERLVESLGWIRDALKEINECTQELYETGATSDMYLKLARVIFSLRHNLEPELFRLLYRLDDIMGIEDDGTGEDGSD